MLKGNKIGSLEIPEFVAEFLISPEEFNRIDELTGWLNEEPENQKVFDECLDIWQASITSRKIDDYDGNEAWKNFKKNMKVVERNRLQPVPHLIRC